MNRRLCWGDKMNEFGNLFVFYSIVALVLQPGLSIQQIQIFGQQVNPTFGPYRLSVGWKDLTLVSCLATCMRKYPTTCLSAMYNNTTHVCTPGLWLNQSVPPPTPEEGRLYVTARAATTQPLNCTTSQGYALITYNTAAACVLLVNAGKTYDEARVDCRNKGGHLYSVRTVDKANLVQYLIDKKAWIGLHDRGHEDAFEFEDKGDFMDESLKRTLFDRGQPDNYANLEHCIVITDKFLKLNDQDCSYGYPYICEEDPKP